MPDPPVLIKDSSFDIETDEQLESKPSSNPKRPFKYKRKKKSGEPTDPHIACVQIFKQGTPPTLLWKGKFNPKECEIHIFWDATECDAPPRNKDTKQAS